MSLTDLPVESLNLTLDSEAQRLLHGRGHCYPGLEMIVVDWFEPILLITSYRPIEPEQLRHWQEQLQQAYGERAQCLLHQRRDEEKAPVSCLWGDPVYQTQVLESGNRFAMRLGQAQNHGLFLDMKNGRSFVQANSEGRKVLNLFAYTCGFSIAAVAGGAEMVLNVDMSRRSLEVGRENHALNGHDKGKVRYQALDIFKSWGRIKKPGPYDLIIMDPPSLQKGSIDVRKDYARLVRRIPELANDGALVMLCLNAPELGRDFIARQVEQECPELVWQESITPPPVFRDVDPDKGLKVEIYKYR